MFKIWFENVFLEDLTERRSKLDSNTNKWAVLISDGFVGHDAAYIKALAAKHFVKIIFLPSHSSHFLQALDKYVFASMKKCYYNKTDDKDAKDRNGKKIWKILFSFYQSTTPMTIRASFKAIGLVSRWTSTGDFIRIDILDEYIIENNQEKQVTVAKEKKRKRAELVNKKDFLANNSHMIEESLGICSLCHQIKPINPLEQFDIEKYQFDVALISAKSLITAGKMILSAAILSDAIEDDNKNFISSFLQNLNEMALDDNLAGKTIDMKTILFPNHIVGMVEKDIELNVANFFEKREILRVVPCK